MSVTPPPFSSSSQPDATPQPEFPYAEITVRPLHDPVLDQLGIDPLSPYVERYWTPIMGPTSVLLLRRFAVELHRRPEGFTFTTLHWAQDFGVSGRGGRNGPFWRAIDRTARYGATVRNGGVLMVRRRMSPLNMHQIRYLPEHLQQAHHAWTAARLVADPPSTPHPA